MKNHKNDLLSINPVENYEAPQIPTLRDGGNAEMLKKLPNRWKKKAAVIACAGIMGTMTLAGCANLFVQSNAENNGAENVVYNGQTAYGAAGLMVSHGVHHGGATASPIYIVHLTEQEMLNIIRAQLEAAGLNLSATPPEYTVEAGWWDELVSLDLFDEENRVAIAHIDWQESHHAATPRFGSFGSGMADLVAERFSEQAEDITFGVFYTPTRNFGSRSRWDRDTETSVATPEPSAEEMAAVGPELREQLNIQVQGFINFLHETGVLEGAPQEVSVTLNGTPMEFDVTPIFSNNRILVPMRAIFEALGLEVEFHDGSRRGRSVIATKENFRLEIGIDSAWGEIERGDKRDFIGLDTNATIHNNRTMVPLRFIAEATGANVEWDEATRTVAITTE